MRSPRIGAAAGAVLLVCTLAACSTPGDGAPDSEEEPPAAAEEVVLPDMTATECAVAGGPWRLDDRPFDTAYSIVMMANDATLASSGFGGNYIIDFWDDGRFRISTEGFSVRTTTKAVDENGTFEHVNATATAGSATAEWGEISDDGASITFIDWTTDIVQLPTRYDNGTEYAGLLPAWQLTGRTGAILECDEDGTGLWIRSTTPGYLDLHFLR